jgi:hypothetical protein
MVCFCGLFVGFLLGLRIVIFLFCSKRIIQIQRTFLGILNEEESISRVIKANVNAIQS